MNTCDKISEATDALEVGHSLQNPAEWKRLQVAANMLAALMGAIFIFTEINISDTQIEKVAYAITIISSGLYNGYFTMATTSKIGFAKK